MGPLQKSYRPGSDAVLCSRRRPSSETSEQQAKSAAVQKSVQATPKSLQPPTRYSRCFRSACRALATTRDPTAQLVLADSLSITHLVAIEALPRHLDSHDGKARRPSTNPSLCYGKTKRQRLRHFCGA